MADEAESQAEMLEKEIASLKEEVANLRKTLKVECSTILSSPSIQKALESFTSNPDSSSSTLLRQSRQPLAQRDSNEQLATRFKKQQAYTQQCLYRISTSVTSFKVHDPDPNAVDGGHILGLRFEIMSRGQFLRPYYVMLHRPFFKSKHLRVHRHTVPPAIPLPGLAARHLPAPKPESDNAPSQNLERFVRTLRREIMRYHNRLGISADLRRSLGLHDQASRRESPSPDSIVDVGIADIEAKQIRLTWADERSGRLVMDDDGKVVKLVVFGADGRDWETTKELLFRQHERVEDVAKLLTKYAAG